MNIPNWMIMNGYTAVLLLLLVVFNQGSHRKQNRVKAFRNLLIVAYLLLTFDSLGRALEINPNIYWLARIGTFGTFALDPLGVLFTELYIESWMIPSKKPRKSTFIIQSILVFAVVLNFVLILEGEITGNGVIYYYVEGVYHRGPLFVARGVMQMLLCVCIEIYILVNRSCFFTESFIPIMLMPIIVLASGIGQVALDGLPLEYSGTALSCLLLFVYVQGKEVNVDFLTGVSTRRALFSSIETAMEANKNHTFSLVVVDVDDFKEINDTYGHRVGDEALRDVVRILKQSFRKEDIIGRYGGDEFCVLTTADDEETLKECEKRLYAYIDAFNKKQRRRYVLHVSAGSGVYRPEDGQGLHEFIEMVDRRMYEQKMRYHATNHI